MFEIRIHARAGQGAKSAAHFLAEAAFRAGKFVQAFPSYGPERTGAPMQAFVRISDRPIRVHSGVAAPRLVIVADEALVKSDKALSGLVPDGILIVNSTKSANELKSALGFSGRIVSVPASRIALQFLGKNLPNTPLLAAAAVATKVVDLAILKEAVRDFFWKKYNQAVADKNVAMMEEVVKGKSVLSLRGVPLQAGRRSNPGSGVKQRIDGA